MFFNMANYKLRITLVNIYVVVAVLLFETSSASTYSVVSYGARGDGRTDSTAGFQRAWQSACKATAASKVYVPRGSFLVKSIQFVGPCRNRVTFQIDGNLVAPNALGALGTSGYWIVFRRVNRMTVTGSGTIDARGHTFWACRRSGKSCPSGARTISFSWSNYVTMSGLTLLNSQIMHVALDHSNFVTIKNMKIIAPSGSPNTDGIHMQHSTFVTISSSTFRTGDDCVSMGAGTKNVWIERIYCGPGHGVSIGSLGDSANEAGVENVTVTSSVFTKTQNGVRIKSWARPSNGYAKNISFRNLIMRAVQNPIIIDQKYCPDGRGCPNQNSGIKISGVTYRNIKGTSATQVAMNFVCSGTHGCNGIRLQDIKLTYPTKTALSYCKYAHGTTSGLVFPKSCL